MHTVLDIIRHYSGAGKEDKDMFEYRITFDDKATIRYAGRSGFEKMVREAQSLLEQGFELIEQEYEEDSFYGTVHTLEFTRGD